MTYTGNAIQIEERARHRRERKINWHMVGWIVAIAALVVLCGWSI